MNGVLVAMPFNSLPWYSKITFIPGLVYCLVRYARAMPFPNEGAKLPEGTDPTVSCGDSASLTALPPLPECGLLGLRIISSFVGPFICHLEKCAFPLEGMVPFNDPGAVSFYDGPAS